MRLQCTNTNHLKKMFWWPLSLFFEYTITINAYFYKYALTTAMLCSPYEPYTLAGFEPGFPISEADAMSTAPRRHAPGQRFLFTSM
jgi:hypothetical protein